ncbi:MAG: hypothetical protein ABSF53_00930 [Terracidiphilus sp.]
MKKLIKTLVLPATLVVCVAQQSWAVPPPTGGSMSGSVAEYNAAQVRDSHDLLTVPAGMVTYTANTAIPIGTDFNVSLPEGFEFTAGPTLTSTAATLTLLGHPGRTARFVVEGAEVAVGNTIVLGGYRVKAAKSLETITPSGNALPLTMQAIGIDPLPLPFNEFASDSGIAAAFAGNPLYVDLGPSSNGKEFFVPATMSTPAMDTLTVQLASVTITAETVDATSVPVLAPDGNPNALSPSDTASLQLPGFLFGGLSVYASSSASCLVPKWKGKVTSGALTFQSLPINQEVFLCAKGSGTQMVKLLGYPNGETTFGFETAFLLNSHPDDDFLSAGNVGFRTFTSVCYAVAPPLNNNCAPVFYQYFKPNPAPEGQ